MGDEAIDRPSLEAWFASSVPGAEPPLTFERISGGRSNLTYGVSDAGGHRWALRRPPLGKRLASAHDMAREHRIISALQEHRRAGAAGRRPLRGRLGQRRALLRHGVRGRPGPALEDRGRGGLRRRRAPRDRRARRRHAGRDPRDRPRPGWSRRARAKAGLRRSPAAPLARAMGEVEDVRAADGRRRPPAASPSGSPSRARRRSCTATTAWTT